VAQLAPLHAEFQSLNTEVVAISFGAEQWAHAWLQETQSPFPVLLDPTLAAYQAYGLERSAWRSWGVKTLWYYARALVRGEKLLEKRGDTHQLGGDFIVDASGLIQLAYPSHDPTDRPSTGELFAVLRRLREP
jgi:alkyl hydroperoxide reductase subunit AhpC